MGEGKGGYRQMFEGGAIMGKALIFIKTIKNRKNTPNWGGGVGVGRGCRLSTGGIYPKGEWV